MRYYREGETKLSWCGLYKSAAAKDTWSCSVTIVTYLNVGYKRLIAFHADNERTVHVQLSIDTKV